MNRDEYRVMYTVEDRHWWYAAMRTTMVNLLKSHLPGMNGRQPRILDAGCGTGGMLLRLQSLGEAVGVDISDDAVQFCRQRGFGVDQVGYGSLDNLPFADAAFDAVVSLDVLCMLPDDRPGFAEIARVLRPGGVLLLNLPALQRLYSEHDLAVRSVRRYTRRGVRRKLEAAGLRVAKLSYANTMLFGPAAAVRLAKRLQGGFSHKMTDRALAKSDLTPPPEPVNRLLTTIYAAEGRLLQRVNLPIGLSIVAVATKP